MRNLFLICVFSMPVLVEAQTLIDLQAMIDQAAPGATLQLSAGRYRGPVVIDKPLVVNGVPGTVIDAGGVGTVVSIDTDGARLSNLHITGSGNSHNDLDAGVRMTGQFNVVRDLSMDDVLFGILVHQSDSGIVRRNRIRSKATEVAQRGDGIRVWYSFGNQITHNQVTDARDAIILDSGENQFSHNQISGGRYGLHVVNSDGVVIRGNRFRQNEAGLFALKANELVIENNQVLTTTDVTGVGIGLKESSSALIRGNRLVNVNIGIALDLSPESDELPNRVEFNTVAYSAIGIRFLSDRGGNHLQGNNFQYNYIPVAVRNGGGATRNDWQRNHWSDYRGFDQDGDGTGDTPYELYAFADTIWLDEPYAQFFMSTPSLNALDFLERLAPFSEPRLLVRDAQPEIAEITPRVEDEVELTAYEKLKRAVGGGD